MTSTLRNADVAAALFGKQRTGEVKPGLLVGVLESCRYTQLGGTEARELRARVVSSAQPGTVPAPTASAVTCSATSICRSRASQDVPELLRHYVDRIVNTEGLALRKFSVAAQNRLRNYPWPDNVRELKNLVHRLLIQDGDEEIRLEEIERELGRAGSAR